MRKNVWETREYCVRGCCFPGTTSDGYINCSFINNLVKLNSASSIIIHFNVKINHYWNYTLIILLLVLFQTTRLGSTVAILSSKIFICHVLLFHHFNKCFVEDYLWMMLHCLVKGLLYVRQVASINHYSDLPAQSLTMSR